MSLAQELTVLGHTAQAVPGKKSQFDVVADGRLVFSKEAERRYPDAAEIVAQL